MSQIEAVPADDAAAAAAKQEKLAFLQVQADASQAGVAALRKALADPANKELQVPDNLLQLAEVIAAKPETAFTNLLALVHADYETQNDLHNARMKKLEKLQAAGTACPANLTDLDLL